MSKLFISYGPKSSEISYEQLLKELVVESVIPDYIRSDNPYVVFKEIIKSILHETPCTILDSDFSNEELKNINIDPKDLLAKKVRNPNFSFNSSTDLISSIIEKGKSWKLKIFTSGTTGRPKSVLQNFDNLTRNVKISERFKSNVWGFAYNVSHFAGLQVFFQALLNLNTIIYLFDKKPGSIVNEIHNNKITHLSFTPTFCKQFLHLMKEPASAVQNITFGGERFAPNLSQKINQAFPNAKIRNVYASTEGGSIFASRGEYFEIPLRLLKLVKVSSENELFLHQSILGESKSFDNSLEWYPTGDIVEFKDETSFKFLRRKSDMINVGGYKVNPHEVEDVIKNIRGVEHVVIKGRKNSVLGNIVVAQIVPEKDIENRKLFKKEILKIANNSLQSWKVPQLIKFLDKIELTRTGKIKR